MFCRDSFFKASPRRSFLVGVAAMLVTASCTQIQNVLGINSNSTSESDQVLNVAIWSNYLSKDMAEKFSKETGIKLNFSNYATNEELLAKIQTGGSGIDVAVPSDYMVAVMAKLNLLEKLDLAQISEFKNIDSRFLDKEFDPKNSYSIPYSFGTTGLAVNRELYKEPVKSWKDVFLNPALAGKFSLLDDVREDIGAVLRMNGHSLNSTDVAELQQAKEVLMKIKSAAKMFTSDSGMALVNKEVMVAHMYSSDALQASAKLKGQVEFVIPEEGATTYLDNLVIVKGAKHNKAAHQFLNFLVSKDAVLDFVKRIKSGPIRKDIQNELPPDLRDSLVLFPTEKVRASLESIKDVGEKIGLYDQIWSEVKSQ